MTWLLTILALSLPLIPLVISVRRSTELFRIKVRDGKARFVRGRMPQSLLSDVEDVVRSPPIERAELWAVRRSGKAHLETKGELSAEQRQRLRNVVGLYSLQRILAGARPARVRKR
jgi:hypothetical protein